MEIDGTKVRPGLENEIKPLYESTFKHILDFIDKAEEHKLDRPVKVGDCYAKITRLGAEEAIITIGLCTDIDHNYVNALPVYPDQTEYSTLYIFNEISLRSSGYSIDNVGHQWLFDLWYIDNQNWYRAEKMLQLVKSSYEAILERSLCNDN